MKFIGYIKGLSLGYAICAENASFEVAHVNDVAYYAEKLAFERGLDQNVALAIAYGHDLGRTRLNTVGKDHARVSAKFMKALMSISEFDVHTQKVIASSIKKHNLKSTCHGVYAELIKDADALAHSDEGLIDQDNMIESFRVMISNMPELTVEVAPLEVWCKQYETIRTSFLHNMTHIELFNEDSRHWIHEQRKNVRKLRSIISYLKHGDPENHFDDLDAHLKYFFGTLSDARRYQVQIEHFKRMPNLISTMSQDAILETLEARLNTALMLIEGHLTTDYYDALVATFNQSINLEVMNFMDPLINQARWLASFSSYVSKATNTDPKKLKSLHKLRIRGKNFKYMYNLGLVRFSSESVKNVIEQLHEDIGTLNDFGDIKKMNLWQTYYESSSVDAEIKRLQKRCKRALFFFVKLDQMIANKHLQLVTKSCDMNA